LKCDISNNTHKNRNKEKNKAKTRNTQTETNKTRDLPSYCIAQSHSTRLVKLLVKLKVAHNSMELARLSITSKVDRCDFCIYLCRRRHAIN